MGLSTNQGGRDRAATPAVFIPGLAWKISTAPLHEAAEIEAIRPDGLLVACDFYIMGAEHGETVPGGYRLGRIVNIDHHAPTPEKARLITSTSLALEYVRACGNVAPDRVVISHTDCDSILSSAVVSGVLDPEERFAAAALAADHTGVENEIADLLQALDEEKDAAFSLASLRRHLAGEPLEGHAEALLAERRRKRELARELVERGRFTWTGRVAWCALEARIDGELFLPRLPEAWAIVLASPKAEDPSRWDVKVRLGPTAPEGLSLHGIGIGDFDPCYGGRWNAGSNRRGGGTALGPAEYAAALAERLDGWQQGVLSGRGAMSPRPPCTSPGEP